MPIMELGDIPIFSMLKSRLGYLSDRGRVIAENFANANTPGYQSHDLKPFSFQAHVQSAAGAPAPAGTMAMTQPGHMQPPHGTASVQAVKTSDSEETLDGNGVVLEDEMVKLTQNRMDYEAAIGFYQQSLSMLKMAVKKPGG
jgi:flagellar basal-body rod protein FlgB